MNQILLNTVNQEKGQTGTYRGEPTCVIEHVWESNDPGSAGLEVTVGHYQWICPSG